MNRSTQINKALQTIAKMFDALCANDQFSDVEKLRELSTYIDNLNSHISEQIDEMRDDLER